MSSPSECILRLIIGLLLNTALLCMLWPFWPWSSLQREPLLALLCVVIGAVGLVSVSPVLRHGTDTQKVAASMLMVLPLLAFWPSLQFCFRYR